MKYALLAFILTAAMSAPAQTTTTNTNCNVFGNQVNCTSTSTDDSAARAAQAERQRENDEAARQAGSALGATFARGMQIHKFHKWEEKYCKAHPGASWWYQFDLTNPNTRINGNCDSESYEGNSTETKQVEMLQRKQDLEEARARLDKAIAEAHAEYCKPLEQKPDAYNQALSHGCKLTEEQIQVHAENCKALEQDASRLNEALSNRCTITETQIQKAREYAYESMDSATAKPIKPLPLATPVSEPQPKEMICVEKMTKSDGAEVCKRWSEPKEMICVQKMTTDDGSEVCKRWSEPK